VSENPAKDLIVAGSPENDLTLTLTLAL